MPFRMSMRIPTTNPISRPNKFVRSGANIKAISNVGKMNLIKAPMIGRLSNSRTCGSCGH